MSYLHLLTPMLTAAAHAATVVRTAVPPDSHRDWTVKGSRDFVTHVDQQAEAIIREIVLGAEPGAGFMGEESEPEGDLSRGLAFVVDPLDGTTNFLHGFPHYAISIGAMVDGKLVAGVVHHVPSGRVCSAAAGYGAFATDAAPEEVVRAGVGARLTVSQLADPGFALIGTGFPFIDTSSLPTYQKQFAIVAASTCGMRRAGSAALDLADVAAGRFDAFWELRLKAWDMAAGIVLIREAGGIVTDLQGNDVHAANTGIVAGGPAMHAWLLDTVQRAT